MEKKNLIIMKKKFLCIKKLNFGLLPKYIARLGNWAGRWARLLGVQALGRRWARAECAGGRAWASGQGRRRGRWQERAGAQAAGRQAAGRQAAGRQGAAGVGALGAGRGGAGRGLGAWAGRGCALGALGRFWPGLTQYFPESNFWDIVREPGS